MLPSPLSSLIVVKGSTPHLHGQTSAPSSTSDGKGANLFSPDDITAALAEEGLTAVRVVRFTKKDGQPSDNLLVGFAHGTLIPSVKKFQYLENVKISLDPKKTLPQVAQCPTAWPLPPL